MNRNRGVRGIKVNAATIEQANQTMNAFGKVFQKRVPVFRGNVVSVAVAPPETGGQVVRANVRLANGTVLPNVSVAGWAIGVGSHVSVRGSGSVMSGDFEIARVHTWGQGVISGNPHTVYSTPNIYDITTSLINTNGTLAVVLNVTVECVVEHWRGRMPTRYIVEVLDEDLNQVDWIESAQYERTAGKNRSELSAGASAAWVNRYTGSGAPSDNFPRQAGVLRGGAELMFYSLGNPDGSGFQFLNLDRGYFGTTPQIHYVDRDISLAGITFATQGLLTNTVYKVRVMAKAADGRTSTWSDVVTVLTEVDTTPPAWSTGANLYVETIGSGFRLRWIDADLNIMDLSHYNIQISDDGVTWIDDEDHVLNAGNGNSWTYNAIPGRILWFRIQAEDYTGNTGYTLGPYVEWSPSVRGALILSEEPSDGGDSFNLISNGKFTTDLTGYSIVSSSGTATITRDTAVYFASSPSSMRWQEARNAVLQSTSEITYTPIVVSGGNTLYLRGYIRRSTGFSNAGDRFGMGLRLENPAATTRFEIRNIDGVDLPSDGNFTAFFFRIIVPAGFNEATFYISITNDAGVGTPQVWVDDVFLTVDLESTGGFLTDESFSDNPGANALPLKSTASGGLTLESLSLTGTGDVETVLGQKMVKSANLSDLTNTTTARSNLGLGNSAVRNVGTTSGDVASGEYAQEVINARGGQANVDARIDLIDAAIVALARFHMRYSTNAGQNLTSGSNLVIDYEDLGFESVDYVTTGASWKFQPSVAGIYRIYASFMMSSQNWAVGDFIQIGVFKNGTAVAFNRIYLPALTASTPEITIMEMVSFNGSSDNIDIRGGGSWSAGGSRALSTDNRMNYIHIDRI